MRRWLLALAPLLLAASPPTATRVMISDSVYPDAAREAGVEGDVAFELAIDDKGKVAGCTVTEGAALPAGLAADTCRLASSRWRFAPARDDAGKKVASTVFYRIAWRISLRCPPPDGLTICVFL